MSLETELVALLAARCPRAFPNTAPLSVARPFVVYQNIGGLPMRYVDALPSNKRHAFVQINIFADTLAECMALARQYEEDICTNPAPTWQATPQGQAFSTTDPDLDVFSVAQDFQILTTR